MKKEEENSIYRIEESAKGFSVQKKTETKTKHGFWFWTKYITNVYWHNLDEHGNRTNLMSHRPTEYHGSIARAKAAIEKFKKFPIYHY